MADTWGFDKMGGVKVNTRWINENHPRRCRQSHRHPARRLGPATGNSRSATPARRPHCRRWPPIRHATRPTLHLEVGGVSITDYSRITYDPVGRACAFSAAVTAVSGAAIRIIDLTTLQGTTFTADAPPPNDVGEWAQ